MRVFVCEGPKSKEKLSIYCAYFNLKDNSVTLLFTFHSRTMPGHGRIQLAVVDQSTNYLNKMAEYISAGMETAIDITQDLVTNDAGKLL